MKKQKMVALIFGVIAVVVLVTGLVLQNVVSKPTEAPAPTATLEPAPATPTPTPNHVIEMAYGTQIQFPPEHKDAVIHVQETHEMVTTEVFSMKAGGEELSLYRFDFGSNEAGDWLGLLSTENGAVPVTYTVFNHENAVLEAMDTTTRERYTILMNCFNDALNAISADPRFTADKPLNVGEDQETKMAYWSVMLPGNMTVSETTTNGTYVAMFFGEVVGERTALYQVRIGEDKAESELGLYEVEGVKKPVSVSSFALPEKPNWTDEDYAAAYRMMDTINDVINVITSSSAFSVPMAEEVAQ